jgi:hypothetical protein
LSFPTKIHWSDELERFGFHNHVRVNAERWANLQKNAFVKSGEFIPLEIYPVGVHMAKLYIYKAMFYKDKRGGSPEGLRA